MSSYTISINNKTDYTPEVSNTVLSNCEWQFSQENQIHNERKIGGQLTIQGTIQPTNTKEDVEYTGTLTLYYPYTQPSNQEENVNIKFGVEEQQILEKSVFMPFIAGSATHDRLKIELELSNKKDDYFGLVNISRL